MQGLNRKFNNKLSLVKNMWKDFSPEWGKELVPYSIKNKTLFFKTKKNPIILQYREQEILKIIQMILKNEITNIKILNI